jgi:tryptophan synthase alpha chain
MDGPVIQAAAQRALDLGVRTRDVLRVVEGVAGSGVPTLVMTYWNPVERYGVERWAADLASAGGAGLITPDITPEEAGPWLEASASHGLDRVFLVAPSSTEERVRYTTAHCSGFVYATAVMGVTGARETTSDLARPLVERTRRVTDLPVGVGLGVSDGEQAADVAAYADGVIVGSAFVRRLLDADDGPRLSSETATAVAELTRDLAEGVRRGGARRD